MPEDAPKKKMWPMPPKKALAVIIVVVLVVAFVWIRFSLSRFGSGEASLPDGTTVRVEIADNKITMERGLAGHRPLRDGEGMIFLFPAKDTHSFWMKGMEFPIDVVWLDGERVTGVTADAQVPSGADFPTYLPPEPIDRVLEVPAGFAAAHGLKTGDTVSLRIDSSR